MKIISGLILILLMGFTAPAQDSTFTVYNPNADALADFRNAVSKAKETNKHVLIQIGGNWCKWCRMFYKWSHENKSVDSLLTADYVILHTNFSKENKNPELMTQLDFPQRFGFPVFVIVDGDGKRLHTQNTGYLEDEGGYSEKKVTEFLKQWNTISLKSENYK
ncbi:MAG: thioredoxin family protein [Bacteroidota bacterium]|nr:thioredoxin family protein [Bacteroidota bacterium]